MSKKPVLYKSLVIGVIVLFIGIGIQPAFAVTPDTSESEADCDICPKVSKSHLVLIKSLLNRLEKYDSNIYANKEYKNLKEELLNNKDLDKDSFCDKLESIMDFFISITILDDIAALFSDLGFKILTRIFLGLRVIPAIFYTPFMILYVIFCWQPPHKK